MFDEFARPRAAEWELAEPLLQTFVYCSRAAEGVNEEAVHNIVKAAQRRNHSRGITGVLVFRAGIFFQWIEGPPTSMQSLIASLYADLRHCDLVALDHGEERRERLYPDWDMEEVQAEDMRVVLEDALASSSDETSTATLTRILGHLA